MNEKCQRSSKGNECNLLPSGVVRSFVRLLESQAIQHPFPSFYEHLIKMCGVFFKDRTFVYPLQRIFAHRLLMDKLESSSSGYAG